jgi:hypothetical protein
MKIYKTLSIKNSSTETLVSFLRTIIFKLSTDWKYRADLLEEYSIKEQREIACFDSPAIDGEKALIWMVISRDELKIVNIVPTTRDSFTVDEYNQILDQFYDDCIANVINTQVANVAINIEIFDIKQIAGVATFEALQLWEGTCDRATGNVASKDSARWMNFVVTAYHEKSALTADLFVRWLEEEKNWDDDDLLCKIVGDFIDAISLLEEYDTILDRDI